MGISPTIQICKVGVSRSHSWKLLMPERRDWIRKSLKRIYSSGVKGFRLTREALMNVLIQSLFQKKKWLWEKCEAKKHYLVATETVNLF